MSSRGDHRRHERDWERDDRDRDRDRDRYSRGGSGGRGRGRDRGYRDEGKRRASRSRSPRRGDRERRDRREYKRDRDDDRKDRERDRDRERDKERKDGKGDRHRDEGEYPRGDRRDEGRRGEPRDTLNRDEQPAESKERSASVASQPGPKSSSVPQPGSSKADPDIFVDEQEEGEEMDATTEDDAAMAAAMGMSGFGSTKGKHVSGNQEGSVNVKKMRTWRQYMNRRGGFNRPLDKIK